MLTRGVGQALEACGHSILRYAESSWGFTEIKQVRARSIQVCRVSMGFNAFVLRVEHPYIVRKLEQSLDMGELTFHAEKTACCRLQQETKLQVLALARQTNFLNCTQCTQ